MSKITPFIDVFLGKFYPLPKGELILWKLKKNYLTGTIPNEQQNCFGELFKKYTKLGPYLTVNKIVSVKLKKYTKLGFYVMGNRTDGATLRPLHRMWDRNFDHHDILSSLTILLF